MADALRRVVSSLERILYKMSNIFDLFKKIEKKEDRGPITHILVGLGNPGREYEKTRHNVGFLAIDYIAKQCGVKIDRARFHALVAEGNLGAHRILFMKPTTYMNNSGIAVGEAAAFYKIPAENVIVLHDEISFDPGIIRIRRKGSAGGHNGLKSLIAHIGEGFPRVKIGVGQKPSPDYDLASWVLAKLPEEGMLSFEGRYKDIYDSVSLVMDGKIDEAMNKFSK